MNWNAWPSTKIWFGREKNIIEILTHLDAVGFFDSEQFAIFLSSCHGHHVWFEISFYWFKQSKCKKNSVSAVVNTVFSSLFSLVGSRCTHDALTLFFIVCGLLQIKITELIFLVIGSTVFAFVFVYQVTPVRICLGGLFTNRVYLENHNKNILQTRWLTLGLPIWNVQLKRLFCNLLYVCARDQIEELRVLSKWILLFFSSLNYNKFADKQEK